MAAISKEKSGFVLVTSLFIMAILLSLGIYLITFSLTEKNISGSQAISVKAYYLAESGLAEAIWKIKNDPTWKSNFEDNASWTVDYSRNPALYPNASYRIQITNKGLAQGDVIVTASLKIGSATAQRVIKTSIYKALGQSVIGQNGEYADGNIDMSGSTVNTYNGGLFSNNNIIINYWSAINANGDIKAVGNVNVNGSSQIISSSTRDRSSNPAPTAIPMPAVSFDNAGDANSYKARATKIYTASQFSDLLWNNLGKTLTLNGITYVTGDIDIKGDNNLIINGALVADGDITVGENTLFCCWSFYCGTSNVTINRVSSTSPSGLLSKKGIYYELCLNNFQATGLIYANDKLDILSLPQHIDVTGALVGRKITLTSLWQGVNITYDNAAVNYGFGDPNYSPVVTVEHWEEEY